MNITIFAYFMAQETTHCTFVFPSMSPTVLPEEKGLMLAFAEKCHSDVLLLMSTYARRIFYVVMRALNIDGVPLEIEQLLGIEELCLEVPQKYIEHVRGMCERAKSSMIEQ